MYSVLNLSLGQFPFQGQQQIVSDPHVYTCSQLWRRKIPSRRIPSIEDDCSQLFAYSSTVRVIYPKAGTSRKRVSEFTEIAVDREFQTKLQL